MSKIVPFNKRTDCDGDLILEFNAQGTPKPNTKLYPHYQVELGWDPLTQKFLPHKSTCTCWSFNKKRQEDPESYCKHQEMSKIEASKCPEELE